MDDYMLLNFFLKYCKLLLCGSQPNMCKICNLYTLIFFNEMLNVTLENLKI